VAWHPDGRNIALGSPGASRITTAVAQTWMRFAYQGASFADAVAAPRLHVEEVPDGYRVQYEPGVDASRLQPEFSVNGFDDRHLYFGGTHIAGRDRDGTLHAIADDRRSGHAKLA
jgi:gamma-glutamyltranspeptidase/glutathione hydrolase